MFFIGIFGVLSKEQEIADLKDLPCRFCDGYHGGSVIKSYSYFHVFFIPVHKWNIKYYVICKGCSSIYEISPEKGKLLETGQTNEVDHWDLKVFKEQSSESTNGGVKKCTHCGETISDEFIYCPRCGKKQ
jgi:hypothetical protein